MHPIRLVNELVEKKGPRRANGGQKQNRGASQRMTVRPGE